MVAVLLFSGVVHLAALALAASLLLQVWPDRPGADEIGTPAFAGIASKFGLGVGVAAMVLSWLLYPFGHALAIGLVVGLLAALMLVLFLAVRPMANSLGGQPWHRRPHSLVFYGTFAAMELVALVFLVAQLGGAGSAG